MTTSSRSARRTVLVTGASSGIGQVTAHHLLDRGWRVFAAARRLEAMEPLRIRGYKVVRRELRKIVAEAGTRVVVDNDLVTASLIPPPRAAIVHAIDQRREHVQGLRGGAGASA